MGSPLAPVLANIFMGFYESKWLNEYNLNKPKFYLRYVDDILAAFDNEQDSLNFLKFLNNRHPNIIFSFIKLYLLECVDCLNERMKAFTRFVSKRTHNY